MKKLLQKNSATQHSKEEDNPHFIMKLNSEN